MPDSAPDEPGHESIEYTDYARPPTLHDRHQPPVFKLPEDVLLVIFFMLKEEALWSRLETVVLRRITHVCHYWRKVAIHAPLLWTRRLSTYTPNWTAMALERTGTAPIEVEINFYDTKGVSGIWRALLRHISHVSSLDMRGSARHLAEAQQSILERKAVMLRKFRIFCYPGPPSPAHTFTASPTILRHAHQLRELRLGNVGIDFNSHLLCNLTTLEITNNRESSVAAPSWSVLFEVLRSMPLLEVLTLHYTLPMDLLTVPPEPVELCSLRRLSLESSNATDVYTLLGWVLFFPLTMLLVLWDHDDFENAASRIFQLVGESLDSEHFGKEACSLDVQQLPERSQCRITVIGVNYTVLQVTIPMAPFGIGDVRFIESIIDLLYLSNIEFFELTGNILYAPNGLHRLVDKMPLLLEIKSNGLTGASFMTVLAMEPLTAPPESSPPICVPKLQTFFWVGGNFSGAEAWVETAVEILEQRQQQGVGLKTLEFQEGVMNLTADMVQSFQRVVSEVIVCTSEDTDA